MCIICSDRQSHYRQLKLALNDQKQRRNTVGGKKQIEQYNLTLVPPVEWRSVWHKEGENRKGSLWNAKGKWGCWMKENERVRNLFRTTLWLLPHISKGIKSTGSWRECQWPLQCNAVLGIPGSSWHKPFVSTPQKISPNPHCTTQASWQERAQCHIIKTAQNQHRDGDKEPSPVNLDLNTWSFKSEDGTAWEITIHLCF